MSEFSRSHQEERPEDRWAFAALRDPEFLEDIGLAPARPRQEHPLANQIKKNTRQVTGKLRQILSS